MSTFDTPQNIYIITTLYRLYLLTNILDVRRFFVSSGSNRKNMKKTAQKVSSFKVKPLGDRILIKEFEKEVGGETKSGIIIPETVTEDKGSKKGKVVAVGEGRYEDGKLIPVKVKVGDTVLFQWGDMLKIDGEEYYMVSENNVLAIVN